MITYTIAVSKLSFKNQLSSPSESERFRVRKIMYVGRFAPSPSGRLHFGSLLTAVASYCDARANAGKFLIRIENTDIPRNQPNADRYILEDLEKFGIEWDDTPIYQLDRIEIYEQALQFLYQNDLVYGCACSRKQLMGFPIYPKYCTEQNLSLEHHQVRLNTHQVQNIGFTDHIQGVFCQNIQHEVGDFVLKRRDGIINYQLAVVVDDLLSNISHIVRGSDLLDNTPRQIYLTQMLSSYFNKDIPQYHYAHLPLALNATGQKLSKQNLATAIEPKQASHMLTKVFECLGQYPIETDSPPNMLKQAIAQWDINVIPKQLNLTHQVFD